MPCSLRHTGLVVQDMTCMHNFYKQVFDMHVVNEAMERGAFLDNVLDTPDVQVHTVKLRAQAGDTLLELLHFISPPVLPRDPLYAYYLQGFTHLALTVDDVHASCSAVLKAGGLCLSKPQEAMDGRAIAVFCRDPEGNLLEIVQPVLHSN